LEMHGGIKVYAGPPTAARAYLEADRGRADDYYLAEGTGLARRFSAIAGRVEERAPLTGETRSLGSVCSAALRALPSG
jgi:exodeoxyribonuclease V alpha subunit